MPSRASSSFLFFLLVFSFVAPGRAFTFSFPRLTIKSAPNDGGWLWGLSWGWGEGELSVVDHDPMITFDARPAFFGGRIPSQGLLGYIIPLDSFTSKCSPNDLLHLGKNRGCPVRCIDHRPPKNETWFALVMRGECAFVEKAREAQRLGAKALVVGGDESLIGGRDELISMYSAGDSSDVIIPATYITHASYVQLMKTIEESGTTTAGLKTVSVLITADLGWEWYSPIITFFLLLLLPSSLTLCTLLIHRIRAAQAARRERAPEEIVNSLPWMVWSGEKDLEAQAQIHPQDDGAAEATGVPPGPDEGETSHARALLQAGHRPKPQWFSSQVECAICISAFEKGERIRILPCGHIFHMDEVDGWLIQRKKLCPVCKADVTAPLGSSPAAEGGEHAVPSTALDIPSPSINLPIASSSSSGPLSAAAHQSYSPPSSSSSSSSSSDLRATERTPLLGSSPYSPPPS